MDHLALLEDEVAAMTAALAAADPDQQVEACPGWTARDLAGHVTGVHRWVLAALETDSPPPYDETPPAGDLAQAYAPVAREMLDALASVPADAPCWTFDRANRTAGFWRRRQLHEIGMHRWDLAPYPLDEQVAADGLDEVLGFMVPRQLKMGRAVLPEARLRLVWPGGTWSVGEGPLTVVEGTPAELLLRLWGRGEPLPAPWGAVALTP
ncbi:MAG: maleylpyruvate isomerase family mycothiol-dependent enzyme [Mycobacteriales bacterium]